VIILTKLQASLVRGLTTKGHALVPRLMADGKFALPESVLNDPVHAKFRPILNALPKIPDSSIKPGTRANPADLNSPIIGSDWELDPEKLSRFNFSKNWKPGEIIEVP
jgi:hypothetical protein